MAITVTEAAHWLNDGAAAVFIGPSADYREAHPEAVQPGHEVITVSHSFIATANAIRYCGAEPVFVDIEADTYNMATDRLADAITDRTRAILCVHQMGMPCNITAIVSLARDRGLAVVEDAACAIGSEILANGIWQRIGRPLGDVACFSLHPRKVITTGEGGMLTTNDAERDRLFRLWRQHGMTLSDLDRHSARRILTEAYAVVGYNYRMSDIQASIGRQQLGRLPDLIAQRRALAARYAVLLADIPALVLPTEPSWARSNWQSYCVRLPAHADQRAVMQAMLDRGVATRRGIMCAHREAPYAGQRRRHPLVESERAQKRCLLLPIYADMTEAEQQSVAAALCDALSTGSAASNGAPDRNISSSISAVAAGRRLRRNGME